MKTIATAFALVLAAGGHAAAQNCRDAPPPSLASAVLTPLEFPRLHTALLQEYCLELDRNLVLFARELGRVASNATPAEWPYVDTYRVAAYQTTAVGLRWELKPLFVEALTEVTDGAPSPRYAPTLVLRVGVRW